MAKRETWLEHVQRISSGVPRKDIARSADIDPSGLSRWFGGSHPSAEKVVAFARGLHQSPVEALIAAGYLEPHEVAGVVEVVRSREQLSNAELVIETVSGWLSGLRDAASMTSLRDWRAPQR